MTLLSLRHGVKIGRFPTMDIRNLQPYDIGEMIRIGDKNDGGYVIPRWLPDMDFLVSFGLGDNWSFERNALKSKIVRDFFVFDHTVSSSVFLSKFTKRFRSSPTNFKANYYRLLVLFRYVLDFRLRGFKHVKKQITRDHSNSTKTNLIEIARQLHESNFALKIDIEGDEYLIIDQIIAMSSRVPLLIIEFHETESMRKIFCNALKNLASEYTIVHTHCNNFTGLSSDGIPLTLELTLLRNDLVSTSEKIDAIPRKGLDSPSSRIKPDISLDFMN